MVQAYHTSASCWPSVYCLPFLLLLPPCAKPLNVFLIYCLLFPWCWRLNAGSHLLVACYMYSTGLHPQTFCVYLGCFFVLDCLLDLLTCITVLRNSSTFGAQLKSTFVKISITSVFWVTCSCLSALKYFHEVSVIGFILYACILYFMICICFQYLGRSLTLVFVVIIIKQVQALVSPKIAAGTREKWPMNLAVPTCL